MSEEQKTAQEEQIEALRALKGKKRKAAMAALLDAGDDGNQDWDTLVAMQADDDKLMRKAVVEVLLETQSDAPPAQAYTLVAQALEDAESSVRGAALKCVEAFPPDTGWLPQLLALLSQKKAKELLAGYGELAVPALLEMFGGDDAKKSKQALGTLVLMGPLVKDSEAIKSALFDAVVGDNKALKKTATQALQDLGIKLELSKEQVLDGIKKGDPQAAEMLKEWGEDALEPFEELVKDEDPKLRKFALQHMVDLVKYLEDDDDYEVLIGALEDDKPAVRKAALGFFAALPFPVEDALDGLDGLYDEPAAAIVLLKYGEAAIPTYKDLIRSQGPKNRRTFASLLGQLAPEVIEAMSADILAMAKAEYDYQTLIELLATLPKLALPKADIAAAIDGHMDSWHQGICKAACESMEKLGQPTRESTWAQCRLDDKVKRHLFRLGAVFTPTTDRPRESALDKRMSDALYDLRYGITFPHGRSFNTFDSYGEVTFYLDSGRIFESSTRGNQPIDCVVFAETSYRQFGYPLGEDASTDPYVYMTDEEDYETSWAYSSLSYFLQHFERPSSL